MLFLFLLDKKNFKKIQTFFQKPLDKRKISAIIKIQRERSKQKMFQSFIKEDKPMNK